MNESPTVFLVDDDPAVRDAVGLLLRAGGLTVEGFANAAEFLATDAVRRPGCLVLDVRMPEMSGLDLQKKVAQRRVSDADYFHDRSRRRADGDPGHEGGRPRFHRKTLFG